MTAQPYQRSGRIGAICKATTVLVIGLLIPAFVACAIIGATVVLGDLR